MNEWIWLKILKSTQICSTHLLPAPHFYLVCLSLLSMHSISRLLHKYLKYCYAKYCTTNYILKRNHNKHDKSKKWFKSSSYWFKNQHVAECFTTYAQKEDFISCRINRQSISVTKAWDAEYYNSWTDRPITCNSCWHVSEIMSLTRWLGEPQFATTRMHASFWQHSLGDTNTQHEKIYHRQRNTDDNNISLSLEVVVKVLSLDNFWLMVATSAGEILVVLRQLWRLSVHHWRSGRHNRLFW